MPLDREAQAFEELRDRLGGAGAVAGRIVGRNLDDLGQKPCLGVPMRADEGVDGGFGRSTGIGVLPLELGYSNPSTRMPS